MKTSSYRAQQVKWFFLLVSAIVLYVYWQIIAPFALVLITAGVAAIVFAPIDRRLRKIVKSKRLSALLMLLLIMVIIVGPLFGIAILMVQQATEVVNMSFASGGLVQSLNGSFENMLSYLPVIVQDEIRSIDLIALGTSAASWAVENIGAILSGTAGLIFQMFIFFMALFYFFVDREKIYEFALDLSPFKDSLDKNILSRISSTVRGVVFGKIVIAIVQAIIAGIGMTIFGVPGAILWASLVVIAAQVPILGTALIMMPAVGYLLIIGETWSAFGLFIWSVVAVSSIDNILSPIIVGAKVHMNQLLILISLLGGLELFGPIGFIIGPTVLACVMVVVELYKNGIVNE